MAVTGKTKQFQNLSNQVKSQTQQSKPQEPTISEEQITQLFDDFWYQPERADITYWSHQPEADKTKLVNELKARRDEEKTAEKESKIKQQWPSHLTDKQITSIYSEYGFPLPKSSADFEFVRQNFPDDENKIRAIFDEKRKQMDSMMKIQGKNTIDNIKQQTTPMNQNNGILLNWQWGWQWGKFAWQWGNYDWQWGPFNWTSTNETKWVIPSRYVPIKFTGDPTPEGEGDERTIWLLDSQTKQIQPFLSMDAFQNFYGDNAATALKKVVELDPKDILPDGPGGDFIILGNNYWINDNGQVPVVDANPQQIKSLYGKTFDQQAVSKAYSAVDGFMDLLVKNGWSGIDSNVINGILNDQAQMAKYISAFAFWGYSLNDVYSDLKRKDLINKGDQSLTWIQVIDPSLTKQEFLKTNNWQISQWVATIIPPASIGWMNSSLLNSPIMQLPDEAFKILVPPIDMNSQDFKDQMDKVQSAFHDILIDQVNANTEAAKAAADDKYNTFREYVDKTYGWKLSADATQWWQQLQKITSGNAEAWLAGSWIEREQTDNLLKTVREQDKQIREQKVYDTENAESAKVQASASPEEIQRMNQEDQAKGLPKTEWRAYRWGLIPSDSMLASLDINKLKEQYPNASEADLNLLRWEILDENGNYRSTLYQNRTDNLNRVKYGWTMNDKLSTTGSLKDFKEKAVLGKNLAEQAKAAAPYTQTDPNNPWDNLGKSTTGIPSSLTGDNKTQTPTAPKFDTWSVQEQAKIDMASGVKKAAEAAWNVGSTLPTNQPKTNASWQTYIPNVESMKNFTNITSPDANKKIYGTPIKTPAVTTPTDPTSWRLKIPNLDIMKKYSSNQYDRIWSSVYLKSWVKQNW